MWRKLPRGSSSLLAAKGRCCTSELGDLDLKFTLKVTVMDVWADRALWGKGPSVHQDKQRQQNVPILQDWFLWQHKILNPNAVTSHHVVKTQQWWEYGFWKGWLSGPYWVNPALTHSSGYTGKSLQAQWPCSRQVSSSSRASLLYSCSRSQFGAPDPCFTCSPWHLRSSVLISASGKGNSFFGEIRAKMKTSNLSFIFLVKQTTQHR